MKENSPICASATATERLVASGWRITQVIRKATSGLPIITTARVPITRSGWSRSASGRSSMPTETKNSTANASRSGSASDAARSE
jgi:hypothetical protein